MDDVDSTLSVIGQVETLTNVASIMEDSLQLKEIEIDVNTQHVISTLADKIGDKYERAAHKSNKC